MIKEINIDLGFQDMIYGKLYLPESEHYPFVILSHGLHSNYKRMEDYALPLLEAGIGSFVFDFIGGSKESKSGGNYLEMTIHSEVSELTRILELFLDSEEIDTSNIYLSGASQGGLVSAIVGKVFPELKGMILMYPAMNIPEEVRKEYPDTVPERPLLSGYEVGRRYIEDARTINIERTIQRVNIPVLIIHGSEDPLVPVEKIIRINTLYKHSTLLTLEGAKHGFKGKDLEKAILEIIDFIQRKS